jgi:hypothetical protein
MLNLSLLTQSLPEDLLEYIKDFTLSPNIRLKLFYEKHKFDETKLKEMLTKFTSKQLEQINWKYLYYKIYKISPPLYDNDNLVPILKSVPNPKEFSIFDDREYEPSIISPYNLNGVLRKYKLYNIIRSDYYSENVQSEMGRSHQQYKNIVSSWKAIHEGQGTSKIREIDEYFQNLEFELIKNITILQKYQP